MDKNYFIELLKQGSDKWTKYRNDNPEVRPSLRNIDFHNMHEDNTLDYGCVLFENVDFSNTDFNLANLRDGSYFNCNFSTSNMHWNDLCFGYFVNCNFNHVGLNVSKLGSSEFVNCTFNDSDLSYVTAEDTKFVDCEFNNTDFTKAHFIGTDFSGSKFNGCEIYGVTTWDLKLDKTYMNSFTISNGDNPTITIDDIELGQFIYLILVNSKLRNLIDTITSKAVLILGRFTPERKVVLDEIKKELRNLNYVPILFDFECPESRDTSETVLTLASMAKFVIADLTDPGSIQHELQLLIPNIRSLIIQPIIEEGNRPYSMFQDHVKRGDVKDVIEYKSATVIDTVRVISELIGI